MGCLAADFAIPAAAKWSTALLGAHGLNQLYRVAVWIGDRRGYSLRHIGGGHHDRASMFSRSSNRAPNVVDREGDEDGVHPQVLLRHTVRALMKDQTLSKVG